MKTPGIDVGKESVKGAGTFVFWDCAGQTEYRLTHGMFLGVSKAIFVVIYDLFELRKGNKVSLICYYLYICIAGLFFLYLTKTRILGEPRLKRYIKN